MYGTLGAKWVERVRGVSGRRAEGKGGAAKLNTSDNLVLITSKT